MKQTITKWGTAALASALLFPGCATNQSGFESPTVQPSDPGSFQGERSGAESQTAEAPKPQQPSGRQSTYSGLQYEVLRPGTGKRPTTSDRVKVHYHGYLPDGTVFDSSVQRGQPAVFGLNQVIAGWREGIPLMREGAKYQFTVPPNLAYGAGGMPPKIGPNQTLMFDVELFEVLD
ncbi:MAG: FKBP-type peptidyl-prolyl cis-trans isomerase [Verrucomicrobiales bacterium]